MINSSPDIETVLLNLKCDCQNAIQWFTDNSMKANSNKFHFMVISSKPTEPQNIELHGGVSITPEPSANILDVVNDISWICHEENFTSLYKNSHW